VPASGKGNAVSAPTRTSPLQTRQIDGKTYRCTAEEFARIHDDQTRLTKRQQTMDFAAVWLPYAVSALVLASGVTCILTGHPEAASWLWGGAGFGAGTSVSAAGVRHVIDRRAATKAITKRPR
jgi:hypothetical protein